MILFQMICSASTTSIHLTPQAYLEWEEQQPV
jgi:hypothetical protein